jgi:hypothetical protein
MTVIKRNKKKRRRWRKKNMAAKKGLRLMRPTMAG